MLSTLFSYVPESVRWFAYRILHSLLHGKKYSVPYKEIAPASYIWIFCSTIGELNACKLLIEHYCKLSKVLLLTDRDIYLDSYKKQFPNAAVAVAASDFRQISDLISQYPPTLAIVCEIPVLLHDAPCRLSYGVLRALKKNQTRICLVNGWLYGYKPACKQDNIEKLLFEQDYLNCFDVLSVQTEEVKQVLLAQGAKADKVVVTGNMKYDNLDASLKLTEQTQALLDVLKQHSPLFVAGCITDIWEYKLVVSAYACARQKLPALKLVIAPRHPEKPEQLNALEGILENENLQYDYRSRVTASTLQLKDVLIIDTFGELKALYSAADACYVGINHNILEPLCLGKPVAVIKDWEPSYPSFPVFKISEQAQMLYVVENASSLKRFLESFSEKSGNGELNIKILRSLAGALPSNIKLIG